MQMKQLDKTPVHYKSWRHCFAIKIVVSTVILSSTFVNARNMTNHSSRNIFLISADNQPCIEEYKQSPRILRENKLLRSKIFDLPFCSLYYSYFASNFSLDLSQPIPENEDRT